MLRADVYLSGLLLGFSSPACAVGQVPAGESCHELFVERVGKFCSLQGSMASGSW